MGVNWVNSSIVIQNILVDYKMILELKLGWGCNNTGVFVSNIKRVRIGLCGNKNTNKDEITRVHLREWKVIKKITNSLIIIKNRWLVVHKGVYHMLWVKESLSRNGDMCFKLACNIVQFGRLRWNIKVKRDYGLTDNNVLRLWILMVDIGKFSIVQ